MNARPDIPKHEEIAEKNGNLPRTSRLPRWNISDGPEKVGSTLNKRNFRIPLGGLANETVPPKKYLVVTFKENTWLKIKENNQIGYRHHIWLKSSSFGSIIWSRFNISGSFQEEGNWTFFLTIILFT